MKKTIIIFLGIILLIGLVSASIGGGRSVVTPETRSKLNHPQEEDISEGFNSVINLIQGGSQEPLNISEEEKELKRLENNYLILQKLNPELQNLTYGQYQIKQKGEPIPFFNDAVNNEFGLFILLGVFVLGIIIWLAINSGNRI